MRAMTKAGVTSRVAPAFLSLEDMMKTTNARTIPAEALEWLEPIAARRLREIAAEQATLLQLFPGLMPDNIAVRAVTKYSARSNGNGAAPKPVPEDEGRPTRKYRAGSHWMQRPENREKMLRMVRRSHRTRKQNRARANTPQG
jgi:hypothetical protein